MSETCKVKFGYLLVRMESLGLKPIEKKSFISRKSRSTEHGAQSTEHRARSTEIYVGTRQQYCLFLES